MLIEFKNRAATSWRRLMIASLVLFSGSALADLPSVEDPSRGKGNGIFETMKNYGYDAGILIGLFIATVAFLGVAWHGITVFNDVQHGKKKWGDLGAVVAVGVIILVTVIWLLTKAAGIL